MRLLAIDPGTTHSGLVTYDGTRVTHANSDMHNDAVLECVLEHDYDHLAVEMVASYGMPVGRETFQTVLWIGRFIQASPVPHTLVYRKSAGSIPGIVWSLCKDAKAKDANIRRALLDRFPATGGGATPQVGTKKQPGPLYGVSRHAWSALAVAVTWFEHHPLANGAQHELNE
ncbi:hypothetical protein CMI37_14965 [Candidatus Pacearchaeota archaeon]|nr:hypothetical protein [Candidatus Pacearchaeota archaeon]|tara:strand:- start:68 stop:583 length:516 start_codon:yes stop_codon:yes gene_type:complete